MRPQDEQRRALLVLTGTDESSLEGVEVLADLAQLLDPPAVALEALDDVVGQVRSVLPSIVMRLSS